MWMAAPGNEGAHAWTFQCLHSLRFVFAAICLDGLVEPFSESGVFSICANFVTNTLSSWHHPCLSAAWFSNHHQWICTGMIPMHVEDPCVCVSICFCSADHPAFEQHVRFAMLHIHANVTLLQPDNLVDFVWPRVQPISIWICKSVAQLAECYTFFSIELRYGCSSVWIPCTFPYHVSTSF